MLGSTPAITFSKYLNSNNWETLTWSSREQLPIGTDTDLCGWLIWLRRRMIRRLMCTAFLNRFTCGCAFIQRSLAKVGAAPPSQVHLLSSLGSTFARAFTSCFQSRGKLCSDSESHRWHVREGGGWVFKCSQPIELVACSGPNSALGPGFRHQ